MGKSNDKSKATRHSSEQQDDFDPDATGSATPERNEKLADDVDALLDDIDGVLEQNAEQFVRQYVQKGGQ
jgi:ubiquitin-like protein Pup